MSEEILTRKEKYSLPRSFYLSEDVVHMAKLLLGKKLVTYFDGQLCAGLIVETEAYRAPDDQACHAYNNRRTPRTEIMFSEGGVAYVYLCYGIHHLFNVVTGKKDQAHAVLIRGLEPTEQIDIMKKRRGMKKTDYRLSAGPGSLAKAMGLHTRHSGSSLYLPESPVWIEGGNSHIPPSQVIVSTRVGVESAGESAKWPWRFRIKGNRWASPAK